ncbi:type II secretion system F family protein [Oceanirhabdus sp. W0125-5]|uniref:type II secretion system F family protein n=1 Tax=Oceanirhabdus sp. W0125-5 TaxID=2999116 RepID=UPI0022F2DA7A|nr:type II secretion system F family protein [Oceanirhabdus sp. W0125-5]WBW99583.1 type II secretion system F family protein [Oceanirhabdus sp. W0125-5]
MPQYVYKIIDKSGKEKKGTFTANNRNEVMAMIRDNGCYAIDVSEKEQGSKEIQFSMFSKVKAKELSIFCRQLHTMLKAGAPLIKSMDIIKGNMENKKLKDAIGDLIDSIQKGTALSEGMGEHSDIFPPMLINMIAAGEMSGTLDDVCLRMALHYEKENKLMNKVKTAMTYPIILLVVSVSVVTFLLTAVMPQFVEMFEDGGVELPFLTRMLMSASDFLRNYILAIIGIIILIVFGYRYIRTKENVAIKIYRNKLSSPLLGNIRRKVVASRFTRTIASMVKSGIPIVDAMEAVAEIIGNAYIRDKLITAKDQLMKGDSFSEVVGKIEEFPPMISAMSKIGEESGELEEILDKTADFYDEEVEEAVKKMTAMMEPLMIIVMAVIIGFIVLSIMLPMFDMANAVNGGM